MFSAFEFSDSRALRLEAKGVETRCQVVYRCIAIAAPWCRILLFYRFPFFCFSPLFQSIALKKRDSRTLIDGFSIVSSQ